jgi:ATP-dependent helicase HrpB
MLHSAGPAAADLAALLSDRDPLASQSVDLTLRLRALRGAAGTARGPERAALERIRTEARRLARLADSPEAGLSAAEMAALAYPDRIGRRRKGEAPRFILSGGKGAVLAEGDPLAGSRFLVVTDTDGNPREARIRQAIAITESEIRSLFAGQIRWVDACAWDRREKRVVARQQERLGALLLDDRLWKDVDPQAVAQAMLDGVREIGLVPGDAARRFMARVALGREAGLALPDQSPEALMASLEDWLLPHLSGVKTAQDWRRFDLLPALRAMLDWGQMQALEAAVPAQFTTPLGRQVPIDYSGEHPEVALRLQELFGQAAHPVVGRRPLKLVLLSPAQRPVQTTMDLPGFWTGSYADVRKDMRAQYPKHPWPEDPTEADPTLRAKRRK